MFDVCLLMQLNLPRYLKVYSIKNYKVNGLDSGMQDVSPNIAKYTFGMSRRKLKVFII